MTIPAAQDPSLVLRTHPRIYVNGIIIDNLHYQAERLPG
jgi:hypothetical protein